MSLAEQRRPNIGVWIDRHKGARWANEGLVRLLGFMIEGSAKSSGPRFHVLTPEGANEEVIEDFRTLDAREGIDWQVHTPLTEQQLDRMKDVASSLEPQRWFRLLNLEPESRAARLTPWARCAADARLLEDEGIVTKGPTSGFAKRLAQVAGVKFLGKLASVAWKSPGEALTGLEPDPFARMAEFAKRHLPVDGWIVLHPLARGTEMIEGSVAVIFPDAIGFIFPATDPGHWAESGPFTEMRKRVGQVLANAPTVVTFSQHVARDALVYSNSADLYVKVIPSAPVSVADQLPFLEKNRPLGGGGTRRHSADLLRAVSVSKGLGYLGDFPFEEVNYFVVSTQDRVSKNIGLAADAAEMLVRTGRLDIKMITTAQINWGQGWTRLPSIVEGYQLHHDVVSMHDLPRPAHAALYHCASLAVHPSFFEGGQGVFPFYEALSVGCPCIMADGPHMAEQASIEPALKRYVFDPFDKNDLAGLIHYVVKNREQVLDEQLAVLQRMKQRTWGDVAREYSEAAVARPRKTRDPLRNRAAG